MSISLKTRVSNDGVVYWSVKNQHNTETSDLKKLVKSLGIMVADFSKSLIIIKFRDSSSVVVCKMYFSVSIDVDTQSITYKGIDTFSGPYAETIKDISETYKKYALEHGCSVTFNKNYRYFIGFDF